MTNTCVRQVVLDKCFPLTMAIANWPHRKDVRHRGCASDSGTLARFETPSGEPSTPLRASRPSTPPRHEPQQPIQKLTNKLPESRNPANPESGMSGPRLGRTLRPRTLRPCSLPLTSPGTPPKADAHAPQEEKWEVLLGIRLLGTTIWCGLAPLRRWALDKRSFHRGSTNIAECRPHP